MPTRYLSIPIALLALLPSVPDRVRAQGVLAKKEILAAFKSQDSFIRHNTWRRLNPEDKAQYRHLVNVLRFQPWYDREAAATALAKAATSEVLKKMVKDLIKHKDPAVRQGMAVALAKMNEETVKIDGKSPYSYLYDALKDKDPMVRRVVVHALRVYRKKAAVEAMVRAFLVEKDATVRSFMRDSLNELTKAYNGPNAQGWAAWWEQARNDPDYELGRTDEEAEKNAEKLGHKLKKRKTVSIAGSVEFDSEERGNLEGSPILVIPPYGYSKNIMMPFLIEIEKKHRVFYIDLPPIKNFKRLVEVGKSGIPYYPIEQLVKAFEDLRKETKQERFAIMAGGMNSWIAMTYARQFPKAVSHMIFICPLSSQKAYADATLRMERQGKGKDRELFHFAMTRKFNRETGESNHDEYHKEKDIPVPEGEAAAIDRRRWSLFFRDERDSLIGILYPKKDHRMGSVAIPDFRCFKHKPKYRIPTLVIAGRACLYSSVPDGRAIAKHYGGICLEYKDSSLMPYAEQSDRFNKDVVGFLAKFRDPLRKKSKSKKSKKKSKKKPKKKDPAD